MEVDTRAAAVALSTGTGDNTCSTGADLTCATGVSTGPTVGAVGLEVGTNAAAVGLTSGA